MERIILVTGDREGDVGDPDRPHRFNFHMKYDARCSDLVVYCETQTKR